MAARSSNATVSAEREVIITRIFDAPRELVFKAWTDPKHVTRWWGPKDFTNPVCEMDVRPGGALRIVMRAPNGVDYPMRGVFREIVEPERLVFTNIALDESGNAVLEGLTTVTFAEHGGKTKLTLQTSTVGLVAEAAQKLEGMEEGWTQSLERLAELVRHLKEETVTSNAKSSADRELIITRVFDAPRSLIFKLWTDLEPAKHWMGPRGFTATHVEGDGRPGGRWRLCLRRDDTGEELWQGGVYREFVEPERQVFTFAWEDEQGQRAHETLITITFTEHAGKTTMIFRQGVFDSVAQRDGHQGGWTSTFDRLEEYVNGRNRR
jgi:uncharacterized protein YndB with AHSA1/START domain